MANIGSFKKSGNDYTGSITTLSVQAKNVRVVPEENRTNDNAPSHRVFVGKVEIAAAWAKRSNEGRDYLGVKLDDPSFTAPSTPTSSPTKAKTPSASFGRAPPSATATETTRPAPLHPERGEGALDRQGSGDRDYPAQHAGGGAVIVR